MLPSRLRSFDLSSSLDSTSAMSSSEYHQVRPSNCRHERVAVAKSNFVVHEGNSHHRLVSLVFYSQRAVVAGLHRLPRCVYGLPRSFFVCVSP